MQNSKPNGSIQKALQHAGLWHTGWSLHESDRLFPIMLPDNISLYRRGGWMRNLNRRLLVAARVLVHWTSAILELRWTMLWRWQNKLKSDLAMGSRLSTRSQSENNFQKRAHWILAKTSGCRDTDETILKFACLILLIAQASPVFPPWAGVLTHHNLLRRLPMSFLFGFRGTFFQGLTIENVWT